MPDDDVTLELVGLPKTHTHTTPLLRVENGIAVVRNEYAESGEARYRLRDGRNVDEKNNPTAWNFWQLSARDCDRLRQEAHNA